MLVLKFTQRLKISITIVKTDHGTEESSAF